MCAFNPSSMSPIPVSLRPSAAPKATCQAVGTAPWRPARQLSKAWKYICANHALKSVSSAGFWNRPDRAADRIAAVTAS